MSPRVTRRRPTVGHAAFLAKALSAAVIFWQHREEAEQAAVWAGLLTNYAQYLDPILFGTTVYEQWEAELGVTRYQQVLEQGKALTLDGAVSEVLALLD